MIVHWEGMENKEEEERGGEMFIEGGRRRKRLSKSIRELSGRFGEGGDMQSSSQLGNRCKEGEEGLEVSSSSWKIYHYQN